jgi:hypothetical protein
VDHDVQGRQSRQKETNQGADIVKKKNKTIKVVSETQVSLFNGKAPCDQRHPNETKIHPQEDG